MIKPTASLKIVAAVAAFSLIGCQAAMSAEPAQADQDQAVYTVQATTGNGGSVTLEVPANTSQAAEENAAQEAGYEISPAAAGNASPAANVNASAWQAQTSHAHN